jgi:hypothetical protein
LEQLKNRPTEADPRYAEAVHRGVAAGALDQSYAYEISAVGSSGTLEHTVPTGRAVDKGRVVIQKMSKWGGFFWNEAEVWLRRTTFTAAWHLEVDKQKAAGKEVDYDAATAHAISSVQRSVFEYRQWNRPKFMRGKLKPFFIFFTHIQHMMEHFAGPHPEKYRTLALLIATAGLMGLPGADDIEELLTFVMRRVNKMYGYEVVPHDVETWVREQLHGLVTEMTDDPDTMLVDLFMYGGASQSMLLPEFMQSIRNAGFDWAGTEALSKLPSTDIQPSITMGRIVPGLEAINATDFDSFIKKLTVGVAGAGFGIPIGLAKATFNTSQNDMQRWMSITPQFMQNPMKAYAYWKDEEVRDTRGNRLARFDLENAEDWAEISARGLGFPLTPVNVQKRENWAFFESKMYYAARRKAWYDAMEEAMESSEPDGNVDAVLDHIIKWNETVPLGQEINGKALNAAINGRLKADILAELELPQSKRDVPLREDIGSIFPAQRVPLQEPLESSEDQKVILREDLPTPRR